MLIHSNAGLSTYSFHLACAWIGIGYGTGILATEILGNSVGLAIDLELGGTSASSIIRIFVCLLMLAIVGATIVLVTRLADRAWMAATTSGVLVTTTAITYLCVEPFLQTPDGSPIYPLGPALQIVAGLAAASGVLGTLSHRVQSRQARTALLRAPVTPGKCSSLVPEPVRMDSRPPQSTRCHVFIAVRIISSALLLGTVVAIFAAHRNYCDRHVASNVRLIDRTLDTKGYGVLFVLDASGLVRSCPASIALIDVVKGSRMAVVLMIPSNPLPGQPVGQAQLCMLSNLANGDALPQSGSPLIWCDLTPADIRSVLDQGWPSRLIDDMDAIAQKSGWRVPGANEYIADPPIVLAAKKYFGQRTQMSSQARDAVAHDSEVQDKDTP